MSRFWSSLVHELTPYVPGEQPAVADVIKLNTNENPYGPSPRALAAIVEAASESLRHYPDPTALSLRAAIAERFDLDAQNIFVGNGSDEVLAHAFMALLKHQAPLLFPDVSYGFYRTYCRLYDIVFKEVPLDASMQICVNDYDRPCGGIVVANPNAPTGTALTPREIEYLVAKHPDQVVLIDEAYVDFGAESAVPLVSDYPNLLVVQTFSKSRGLAGLRVGFAIGQPPLIEALNRVKDSFNSFPLDRLALAGAEASWQDLEWFEDKRNLVLQNRETVRCGLVELGFQICPSSSNFLFVKHGHFRALEIVSFLQSKGILVRHFANGKTADHLRITIGTAEECARLLSVLEEGIAGTETTPRGWHGRAAD